MLLHLTQSERDALNGSDGDATAMAMRIVVAAGDLLGADSLVGSLFRPHRRVPTSR